MKYRLTALTPLLVGDGDKLAPIDYMVWKDQINVLDQQRIFRLLSRGPRLEGYLAQLRRADRLDFASWGGFAQNYAERRIPFEHPSSTPFWNSARVEDLFIPTFAAGPHGPYLPASALKGALRTAFASSRLSEGVMRELAQRMGGERGIRRPGEAVESMALGGSTNNPMRALLAGDSDPINPASFRVYLLRVAALLDRSGRTELGWRQAPRGYSSRAADSTPIFAEMAPPRTSFTGRMKISSRHDARKEHFGHERIFGAANQHAEALLRLHRQYAERAELGRLRANLDALLGVVEQAGARRDACVLNLGWSGGFAGKTAFLDTNSEDYRKILRVIPFYERAIRTGMPFPKTRRIVFEGGEPSTLAGWALLEFS